MECEGKQSEIYQKERTDGDCKKNSDTEEGRDTDLKGNKEQCSDGDRSCRPGQGIMVLLHF